MPIKRLCTLGEVLTYNEFCQLDKLCKQYKADEKFREEFNSSWRKDHPMVVTKVR